MAKYGKDEFGIWAVIQIGGEPVKFRYCPPGAFVMGSTPDEPGHDDDEEPQHPVQLSRGFWLAETPTTQRLWTAVENNNPSHFKGDELPVENVSWDDVNQWIRRANQRFMTEQGQLRLPTEAEWEYAAHAGSTRAGFRVSAEPSVLGNIAWFSENSGGRTHPVGQKMPNVWGLHDMLGNVSEWCADWRRDYAEECSKTGNNVNVNLDVQCFRTSTTIVDPLGLTGSARAARGGSWTDDAHSIRVADRRAFPPDNQYRSLGFRLAISE
jgi:formylglycine-generating enzyme required for sulfatase activity